MSQERILWIDNAKAIAILIVVIGHIIQFMYCPGTFDQNTVFRYIYSFHMPLFFMLSGLVTKPIITTLSSSPRVVNGRFGGILLIASKLNARFLQLVVPFCIWGIVWTNSSSYEPYYRIFIRPDLSLWFLWVLFFINVAFYVGQYLASLIRIQNLYIVLPATYIVLKVISHLCLGLFGSGMVSEYFIYFALGIIIGQYKSRITTFRLAKFIAALTTIVFLLFASVWYRIANKIPENMPQWISVVNTYEIYRILTAVCGSLAFILTSASWMNKCQNRGLLYIGMNTLGIYAIHQSIIWLLNHIASDTIILFMHSTLGFFCSFVVVLIITILLLEMFKFNKYSSFLFLGDVQKFNPPN